MDDYIQISKLNDFVFCPKSIYYHNIYESFSEENYHSHYQTIGKIHHKNIDQAKYSSSSRYLQGITVFSKKLNLVGKIDIYDKQFKKLIERKYKIKKIFDGYKYQIFAQYYCLKEMGYKVKTLSFHSLSDNKNYSIELPTDKDFKKMQKFCKNFREFDILNNNQKCSSQKCKNCIYSLLCN